MREKLVVAVVLVALGCHPGEARPAPDVADPEAWLAALGDDIAADLAAGRPLVVQVHVPLCDNDVLRCGNARLGDGDTPRWNLYWGTSEGFLGWFGRRGSGWRQVLDGAAGDVGGAADVLDVRVWRRTVTVGRAWRRRGAPARAVVYVVAQAWRGEAIDGALAAYLADLYGGPRRDVRLPDGTILAAGGAARIVAYVGHNRLMDVAAPDWVAHAAAGGARRKGAIAIACHTAAYMADDVPAPTRVPLLFTRDFLMASAPTLEGAVLGLVEAGDYRSIRRRAAGGYATGQGKALSRVQGAFTNPGDRRWAQPRDR